MTWTRSLALIDLRIFQDFDFSFYGHEEVGEANNIYETNGANCSAVQKGK